MAGHVVANENLFGFVIHRYSKTVEIGVMVADYMNGGDPCLTNRSTMVLASNVRDATKEDYERFGVKYPSR